MKIVWLFLVSFFRLQGMQEAVSYEETEMQKYLRRNSVLTCMQEKNICKITQRQSVVYNDNFTINPYQLHKEAVVKVVGSWDDLHVTIQKNDCVPVFVEINPEKAELTEKLHEVYVEQQKENTISQNRSTKLRWITNNFKSK